MDREYTKADKLSARSRREDRYIEVQLSRCLLNGLIVRHWRSVENVVIMSASATSSVQRVRGFLKRNTYEKSWSASLATMLEGFVKSFGICV